MHRQHGPEWTSFDGHKDPMSSTWTSIDLVVDGCSQRRRALTSVGPGPDDRPSLWLVLTNAWREKSVARQCLRLLTGFWRILSALTLFDVSLTVHPSSIFLSGYAEWPACSWMSDWYCQTWTEIDCTRWRKTSKFERGNIHKFRCTNSNTWISVYLIKSRNN